ncbi:MAG: response regulator [Nitrospina sp.]|jgi:signal transduction histidine kinase/CheY-like chemotaxis protein|nr:response regulator [Nitrospina sp.]MBT3875723.1 response regulator [Nitrospina sp.]MBT4048420.1 response regulator [Nitrospina sp.]MBT4557139.1 response regulator [Nitrospina sp.]MBT5652359.1 response regulator [Nitrospina sp.]
MNKMNNLTLDALLKSVNEDSSVNSLVQASPVCHKIFDPDFKLKFMSKSGVTALKVESAEDFYGKIFPTDDAPKATRDIVNKYMHLASEGETNTIEYSFEVDKKVIWFRTTISPYFDAEGNLIYITADSMDITSNKKIEETNRTLLETSPICLKEIHINNGPGYTLMFMSQAGQEQLGITNIEEFLGKPYPPAFFPDKARTAFTKALDSVVSTGESVQVESELVDTHGKPLWYLSTFSVLRKNVDREVISITGASQNVTEKVVNQTALAKSKEEAERANGAKSEFLSRMSHELRTPMNAILGFTQLLQMDSKSPLTARQNENLELISSAGDHLLALINEVLDLSKIESGNLDLVVKPINLNELMDSALSFANPLADEKGIILKYKKNEGKNYCVEADMLRLRQVLLNLISNAVKYNKPGGSVEVSFGEQEGDKIRIGIRDTGRGIPSDKKDRIFEPFERFDTDIENIEGTGVGLTISKQLVEMMGGTIGFETAYGEGSFFYFDIPISDKTIAPLETEIPPDLIPAPLPKPHDRTVLYIDDTPTNLQLVQQILSHRKHIKLLTAPSARLGIELAQAEIPDLILMDIQMPEMDGLEAFKRLEDIKETQSIPVIALTAYAMDADIKKAAEIGFKDYISKPIDVYKFLNTMDKLLK